MTEHNSQGQIFALFPTPLYTNKAEGSDYKIIQNEIAKVTQDLFVNNTWKQHVDWDSSTHFLSNGGDFNTSIIEERNMNYIKSFIIEECKKFMQEMEVKPGFKPTLGNTWLTLTKPGQHAHIHDHGTNSISGVYWFRTNGQDGDIFFRNALKALKSNPIGHTQFNETTFSPEQGRIAMWPSYLDHGVRENKTTEDRISLSFNISIQR
jgi:uncharacterized protein (TIGR02466 family)